MKSLTLFVLSLWAASVTGRALLGVDMGSLYMKVALVQSGKSGSPFEIVTNLHSKRKTEQMILFDREQRFYGADASSLLARKSQNTPLAMSLMLGRDDQHPVVQVLAERHYPIRPAYNETRSGVVLTVDGIDFTPEELVAMVLTHAVDISVAHAASHGSDILPPSDCMLTTPMYATQHERRALWDAAKIADLNVLGLIDENTAAALNFAMGKDIFEEGQEKLILFYNMGASALQVSLVRFFMYDQPQKFGGTKATPALEVIGKTWDETLGGEAFDHIVVEFLADEFNKAWRQQGGHDKDVRDVPRAMIKLRLQANKIKHVLSANTEIPVHVDAVHEDVSLTTHMTRRMLEDLGKDLWTRAIQPVQKVLDMANKTLDDLSGIELIGGSMRIPRVKAELENALQNKIELGYHINADESMALGAAFAGANVSTAFRVRPIGLVDINPFGMSVTLSDVEPDAEEWSKQATIFKAYGNMGIKKTIAFTHSKDVQVALDYEESDALPKGTQLQLDRYKVTGIADFAKEMEEKGLGAPKVALQFELSTSGISSLVKAEASVEETYTVEEEVEVTDGDDDSADEKKDDDKKEDSSSAEEKNDDKETKKEKKTVKVVKEKKRTHKRTLTFESYNIGRLRPHTTDQLAASKAKLLSLAQRDKERMMLEEARNNVEAYIYKIKNKLQDDEEIINQFSTKKERETVSDLASKAEDWTYDEGYTADLATTQAKYIEISEPFEKILLRISEATARPQAVSDLEKKLLEVEELMKKWESAKPQVTEDERKEVLGKVATVRKWLEDMQKKQDKKKDHEDPAFLSHEVAPQLRPIESLVVRLSKKPKPKPEKKKEDKPATDDDGKNTTETDEKKDEGQDGEEAANTPDESATEDKPTSTEGTTTESEEL